MTLNQLNQLILIFSIFVTACSNGSNEIEGNNVFSKYSISENISYFDLENIEANYTLNIDNQIGNSIPLSEIVKDFHYLKLNIGNKILGEIDKLIITDSIIIVSDRNQSGSVLGFERSTGNLMFWINELGEGPEQYLEISDIEVDEINNEIIIFGYRKIIRYDFNGDFINSKNPPAFIWQSRYSNGIYVSYSGVSINNHLQLKYPFNNFLLFDSTNTIRAYADGYEKEEFINNYTSYDYLNRHKYEISFVPPFGNGIYVYNSESNSFSNPLRINSSEKIWKQEEARIKSFDEFTKESYNRNIFFTHGSHFINDLWFGILIRTIQGKEAYIF